MKKEGGGRKSEREGERTRDEMFGNVSFLLRRFLFFLFNWINWKIERKNESERDRITPFLLISSENFLYVNYRINVRKGR